jgi:uncharacterized Zn finger protein (UPF0148 family)
MTCPKCNHEVHEDSQGVISCLSCGYREPINQVRDTAIYSNRDLMKRDPATESENYQNFMHGKTNDAGEKLQSTEATLIERGNRYGEFSEHARISQELKTAFFYHSNTAGADGTGNMGYTDYQREALEMIFHKLARIANGDPTYIDSWADICGYSQLVVDELTKEQK